MPKSPSINNDCKIQNNEAQLLDALKERPEIFDSLNLITRGRKKYQSSWDDVAAEFNCTTEVLKKIWLKARPNIEVKKERPKSTKSIEPTRRSLRSRLIEESISITMPKVTDSCATNSCGGSPRTSSNLETINECDEEVTMKPMQIVAREPAREDNDEVTTTVDTTSMISSNPVKLLEANLSTESKHSRHRYSEPAQIPKNAQNANNSPRRIETGSRSVKINRPSTINPDDPTRVFFESMGLTVMSFPQHLQASVKVQVSNIIHELEYDLSVPGNVQVDKSIAVMAS